MMKRRLLAAATGSSAVLVALAATAWACVSGPVVNLATMQAKAGEEISVTGTGFRNPDPVTARFNALDGPVIGTFAPPVNRNISGTVTIPAGTAPGNYVLVFTQTDEAGKLSLSPIRSLVTVVGPTGQAPVLGASLTEDPTAREPALIREDNSISGGTLVLISLGVAGVGMFIAGVGALISSRRPDQPVPATVRTK